MEQGPGEKGTHAWRIMDAAYPSTDRWDVLSFEWDYFMIHNDDGSFSGSLGYLIANPRGRPLLGNVLGKIVPGGGNIAIAGLFEGSGVVADYENFDPDNGLTTLYQWQDPSTGTTYDASKERFVRVENTATGRWGMIRPHPTMPHALELTGRTENFQWNVTVKQEWKRLSSAASLPSGEGVFRPETDNAIDTGILLLPAKQQWNVHMLWPRTRIVGVIERLDGSGAVTDRIDVFGHGYRENSWGRWAFNQGGWDFATVSDDDKKVMMGWQSYHHRSNRLDYVDLGFVDDGEYKLIHFDNLDKDGIHDRSARQDHQVGWTHADWKWDNRTWQCVPMTTDLVAQNEEYRLEAHVDIGSNQIAMLSNANAVVSKYFIQIHIPWVSGKIYRRSTGELITQFAGRGGGEFSNARAPSNAKPATEEECRNWGKRYSMPLPDGAVQTARVH